MKKITPDPPVMQIRPGLTLEQALGYAAEHLARAVLTSQEALTKKQADTTAVTQSIIYQVEVAQALIDVSLSKLPIQ